MSKKAYIITIILLIIVILGLGGYIVYDKYFDVKENNIKENQGSLEDVKKKQEDNDKVKQEDDVPITDKYGFAINIGPALQFYLLKDGELYYEIIDSWETYEHGQNYASYINDFAQGNSQMNNFKKYDGVKDIKRIKSANTISSGVDFNLLLITQHGKVYELTYTENKDFNLKLLDIFKEYEVEDILKWESPKGCVEGIDPEECTQHFELLLKDGTTVKVS